MLYRPLKKISDARRASFKLLNVFDRLNVLNNFDCLNDWNFVSSLNLEPETLNFEQLELCECLTTGFDANGGGFGKIDKIVMSDRGDILVKS